MQEESDGRCGQRNGLADDLGNKQFYGKVMGGQGGAQAGALTVPRWVQGGMRVTASRVTAVWARIRPFTVAPVCTAIMVPARMIPWK